MDGLKAHSMEKNEVVRAFGTDAGKGLSSAEAADRIRKYGMNKLSETSKEGFLKKFIVQFKDVMILILLAATVVSFVVALQGDDVTEFFEPALILAIVILNAVVGVMQENKAEKAMDALKSLSSPHARVIRDGAEQIIEAAELVPGDLIRLEAGDFVPADARVIASAVLMSDESILTGESVPASKNADSVVDEAAALGDRSNMLYSGCSVTNGTASCIVTDTGMHTEIGKISGLLQGAEEGKTPLQQKLAQLGKILGIAALAACAVIFVIGLMSGMPILTIFMTAVSLAVSAIPEGLPAIVTVILSLGVEKMAKRNAIVRRLPAVETLGSASVICSDKTGTLTQNKMTLTHAYLCEEAQTEEITAHNSDRVRKLLKYACLCCDGAVVNEGGKLQGIGDPTETAILFAAINNGIDLEQLKAEYPRLAVLPFDSDRKLMTTVHRIDGKLIAITKGAYDVISDRAVKGDSQAVTRKLSQMSEDALRVLAVATRELDSIPAELTSQDLEKELELIGLLGMIDPPRPEIAGAVAQCRAAGIKPVMITGDHVITASAIASRIGIMQHGDRAVSGVQLSKMTDDELKKDVRDIAVYARVSPEDKIRIVRAWQSQGETVAMTGDGVNDAPALKAADIGCAMGITGTDVAKSASAMTLSDDNFSTIVEAVREGRGIYDNIRKVVGFLLGTNIGEILCVFLAMLLWRVSPLISTQLLLVNLATDSLPAIALGMEKTEDDVMQKQPRPRSESIFANGYGIQIALQGLLFGALTLIAYKAGTVLTGVAAGGQSAAFVVLALSQVVQSFNMRSEKSLLKIGVFGNRMLNLAAVCSFALVLLVALIPPFRLVFGLIPMPAVLWLICAALVLMPVPVMEIMKYVKNKKIR